MKKNLLALILTLAMALSLAACGGGDAPADSAGSGNSGEAPSAETQEPADSGSGDKKVYEVGISQFVTHDALDAATQGFIAAMNDKLGEDGWHYDLQNAANDPATCSTIANSFVSKNVDLIMANATPAVQAAAAATGDIPILGTSVTEYGVAFNIENFSGTLGTNVSGTSDLAPLDQQAEMIKEWYPDAKTVGLLYCSNEANSQYQVDTVQGFLEGMGFTCTQYAFTDSNDVAAVCQTAADASDVLYIPTDNTAASNTPIIDNICHGTIPVFCGEEGICAGCGIATLSISYYDIGYKTGEMAAQILTEGADISTMPIEYAPEFVKKYNPPMCEALNITAPEGYEAIG
ncbi:ABC transporter substrate-binding protein [uncultured Oscillibacter sp.]|uniref:ABC transporter substrate-binding protein n=1 Tax=uncultured Oscillibacter sp. TaxID=876091 RepID=UPI002172CFB6|nr:ABC transporter substrate-binding protein [uncultured Oscillibacter sp.]MCI9554896.1 ABC transporter substrate-binding protein [Oscillibacter sp.]